MTDQQIMELIHQSLAEVAPKNAIALAELHDGASLRELGVDSLSAMELVTVIESRIGRSFADESLSRVARVGDLLTLIRAAVQQAR
jgi:acyl carrier protein